VSKTDSLLSGQQVTMKNRYKIAKLSIPQIPDLLIIGAELIRGLVIHNL
jgi:hypothetical protein